MKTLIVGLGNPILTDDGVGAKVAYAIEEALATQVNNGITITEASVGGLRLMEMMIGYDRAIVIDALTDRKDAGIGSIHRMTLEDLRSISPTQHSASAHDTSLVTALEAGRLMGLHLPEEIIIYAIVVENIIDFCDEPTPDVAQAIPNATTAILRELRSS